MGGTSGAGTTNPSEASEFTPFNLRLLITFLVSSTFHIIKFVSKSYPEVNLCPIFY
jgi:hypothetical protein